MPRNPPESGHHGAGERHLAPATRATVVCERTTLVVLEGRHTRTTGTTLDVRTGRRSPVHPNATCRTRHPRLSGAPERHLSAPPTATLRRPPTATWRAHHSPPTTLAPCSGPAPPSPSSQPQTSIA